MRVVVGKRRSSEMAAPDLARPFAVSCSFDERRVLAPPGDHIGSGLQGGSPERPQGGGGGLILHDL